MYILVYWLVGVEKLSSVLWVLRSESETYFFFYIFLIYAWKIAEKS